MAQTRTDDPFDSALDQVRAGDALSNSPDAVRGRLREFQDSRARLLREDEITPLTPRQEEAYRTWLVKSGIDDADEPEARYDYRGLFLAVDGKPIAATLDRHFPDTFKRHGHPTFSVESKYSHGRGDGGHWEGDQFVPSQDRFYQAVTAVQHPTEPQPPANDSAKLSPLSRAVDAANVPLLPQISSGAHRLATWMTTPRLSDSQLNDYLPGVGTLSAAIRGGGAGLVEGVGDLLSSFTSPLGAAATVGGVGGEAAAAARAFKAAQALRAMEALASGAFAERGLEETANAKTLPEAGRGIVQTVAGGLGVRGGVRGLRAERPPVPTPPRAALPAGASFVVDDAGTVARPGDAIPMVQQPDGSYVRSVPGEYARREVRAALPPGPRFIADEAGHVAPLAEADAFAQALAAVRAPAAEASRVRSVPAAPLTYTAETGQVRPATFSGDVNATPAPHVDLDPLVEYALKWMRQDLEALPFTRRTFNEAPRGHGGDLEVVAGAAGAPIYRAVVGAEGREVVRASRADVLQAIDHLLAGKLTKTGELALGVARDLVDGNPKVTRLMATPPPAVEPGPALRGEAGRIDPALVVRAGLGGAGAAYGAATGDDTTDRLKRAALFGAAGLAAPSLLRSGVGTNIMGDLQALSSTARRQSVSASPEVRSSVPRAGEIPAARLGGMPALTDEVQSAADAIAERYGGFTTQRRGVQSQARTEALADRVDVRTDRPLTPGTALNAEKLRAYQNATATVLTKQRELEQLVRQKRATPAQQLELEAARSEGEVLTATLRGAAAEAGRSLQVLRYQARILASADPEAIREAVQITQRGIGAQARSLYYANILSGLPTHERNFLGNVGNAAFNLAAHPFSAGADVLRSAVTGQPRTVFLGELPHRVAGTVAALPKAFSNALHALRTGIPVGDASSFDRPIHREFIGGGVNPFNWPGRALEASDDLFATIASQQTLYGAAFAQAKTEGLRGDALLRRVAALKANPSEAVLQDVNANRERLLFRERPGAIANAIRSAKVQLPLLDYVVPFVRVPANIIRQGLEASPIGFAMKSARQGGRAGAEAQGRAALGTVVLAPLAYWAAAGKITGDAPRDPGERAAFYESGKRPNSVQIGDTWYSYQAIQPLNVPLSLIANGFETWRHAKTRPDKSADRIAAEVLGRTAGSLMDQSFLSGVSALVDALGDPERHAQRFVQQLATGFVPFSGALRTITQATDPYVRTPRSIPESVQAILPGQSQKLEPRLTRFGDPVERGADPLNVFKPSPNVHDPVADTLDELGITPVAPNGTVTVRGQKLALSEDQEFAVRQARGVERRARLEQVMAVAGFARLSDDNRRRAVERAMSDASAFVGQRAQVLVRTNRPFRLAALVSPQAQATPKVREIVNTENLKELSNGR